MTPKSIPTGTRVRLKPPARTINGCRKLIGTVNSGAGLIDGRFRHLHLGHNTDLGDNVTLFDRRVSP